MQPHEQLQRITLKTGWTQAELADQTGLSVRQIKKVWHQATDPNAQTRQAVEQLYRRVRSRSFRLEARAGNGAKIWLKRVYLKLEHGGRGLSVEQIAVYAAAIRAADPLLGADLAQARALLQRSGFTVAFVARPRGG
jgi:transcriptional regulator with XRE-family HTH domain